MATIETKARRGHYLAQLDGGDPSMGLHREFSNGVKVSSRRVYKHTVGPGFYELQSIRPATERKRCGECGRLDDGKDREYFAVTAAGEEVDLTRYAGQMDRISALPPLGECDCAPGKRVKGVFYFCELHTPSADVKEDAPDEAPF